MRTVELVRYAPFTANPRPSPVSLINLTNPVISSADNASGVWTLNTAGYLVAEDVEHPEQNRSGFETPTREFPSPNLYIYNAIFVIALSSSEDFDDPVWGAWVTTEQRLANTRVNYEKHVQRGALRYQVEPDSSSTSPKRASKGITPGVGNVCAYSLGSSSMADSSLALGSSADIGLAAAIVVKYAESQPQNIDSRGGMAQIFLMSGIPIKHHSKLTGAQSWISSSVRIKLFPLLLRNSGGATEPPRFASPQYRSVSKLTCLEKPLTTRLPLPKTIPPPPGTPAIKTQARSATILPNFVGLKFAVHNGMTYNEVYITDEMVGRKLGEFSQPRLFDTFATWQPMALSVSGMDREAFLRVSSGPEHRLPVPRGHSGELALAL
ncbi:hypothetical protein PABG_04880 [Paracoccidioides brasiliensis Pb03]|nr:hypothetical protein PABG_04880 [Paracoccidioides brasiliensis Pb03]